MKLEALLKNARRMRQEIPVLNRNNAGKGNCRFVQKRRLRRAERRIGKLSVNRQA